MHNKVTTVTGNASHYELVPKQALYRQRKNFNFVLCHSDLYSFFGPTVNANVVGIATRGYSIGKGSDELASQRESGAMDNELPRDYCASIGGGRACTY